MDPQKTALLVIDMQNDVLKKLGEIGRSIIPEVQKTIESCRQQGIPIIHVRRLHRPSGIDVENFRLENFEKTPFLVMGTKGADIIDELKPEPTDLILDKQRFSAFFQTDLLMLLMRKGIKTVILCGVQTPNCVRSTAVDAIGYDFEVTIVEDATAAQTEAVHQANLFDLKNMGVKTCTAAEICVHGTHSSKK